MDAPEQSAGAEQFWRDLRTPPNLMSTGRVLLVAVAALVAVYGPFPLAVVLGTLAGITDYLDGWLARRMGLVSELGALLDQVSDVIFNLFALCIAVTFDYWPFYLLPIWAARDITVLAVRASAAQQGFSIPSIFLGKLGTNFMGWSYVFLIADGWMAPRGYDDTLAYQIVRGIGLFGIHGGILFQWISAGVYVRRYVRGYRGNAPLKDAA